MGILEKSTRSCIHTLPKASHKNGDTVNRDVSNSYQARKRSVQTDGHHFRFMVLCWIDKKPLM